MSRSTLSLLSLLPLVFVVACSDEAAEDLDVSSRDPRCVSACTQPAPPYEGAGEICDAASRLQCLDECETRIANVATVCQNCLTEDACFSPGGCYSDDGPGGLCTNTTCTLTSELGMCSYTIGDQAAKLRCHQQLDPRREVSCTAQFQPTSDCASVCN